MADRTIKTILRAETAAYQRDMAAAAKATEAVGSAGAKAGAQGKGAFATLAASAKTNEAAWRDAGQALAGIGTVMAGVGTATLAVGISYNTLQQQSRAALKTLTGSAAAANIQMDKLDDFARNSPFAKQTFIQAQQQMLGFGIESSKVIGYLDAIQNAVAAFGGSNQQISEIAFIMSQISAAGKITATDLMQLGQRGVDAATLIGSQMGMTGAEIRESITDGSLDAGEALDALAAGMSERFDGAAAGVKDTMVGAFDRVKAAFRDLASELAEPLVDPQGGGFLVDATNKAADFLRAIEDLPGPVKAATSGLFALTAAATLGGGAFMLLLPRILETRAAVRTIAPDMRKAAGAMLSWRNAAKGGALIAGFALANSDLAEKTGMANAASWALMGTIAGPWGAAIGGGIGLLKDIAAANNDAEDATKDFHKAVSDGAPLDELQKRLKKNEAGVEKFKKSLEFSDSWWDTFNVAKGGRRAKNWLEGFIGDSDVEELEKKRDRAQEVFDDLSRAGETLARGPGNLTPSLDEMTGALADALPVAQELFPELVGGFEDLTKLDASQLDQVRRALDMSEEVRRTSEAFDEAIKVAGQGGSAFLALGESLSDSKVSLGDWIGELEKQNTALANVTSNIETLANRGIDGGLLQELASKGPEGALRMQELADASDDMLIRASKAFRAGKVNLRDYNAVVDEVYRDLYNLDSMEVAPDPSKGKLAMDGLLDSATATGRELDKTDKKKVHPFINTSSIDSAKAAAQSLNATLDFIARNRTVQIGIRVAANPLAAMMNPARILAGANADGGTIRRFDSGGTVPGQRDPYGDKVLTYLAPGEEVISNRFGQADRHRELLKAINANSFASGGTVGSSFTTFGIGNAASAQRDLSKHLASVAGVVSMFGAGLKGVDNSLKGLRKQLKAAEKELERERKKRSELIGLRDSLADSIRSNYRSSLAGESPNPFVAGATSPTEILQADMAQIRALNAARKDLRGKGVKGGALDALLQEMDVESLTAMSSLPAKELRRYQRLYGQRESMLSSAGTAAGRDAYGDAIKAQTKEVRSLKAEVKGLRKDTRQAAKQASKDAAAGRNAQRRGARQGKNNRKRG